MKRFLFIALIFVLPVLGAAQYFPSQQWHEGEVTLNDNSVISGLIHYDLDRDAIQIRVGERIEAYSSQRVFKFSFTQKGNGMFRRFFALPYDNQPGYKSVPKFFEVILEGKMTLLAREYITQVTTGTGGQRYNRYRNYPISSATPQTITRRYLTYKMYFLDHEGKLTEYSGRKKDLYLVLNENLGQLKKYIKSNRINVDKLEDVAKLVAHYNTLI